MKTSVPLAVLLIAAVALLAWTSLADAPWEDEVDVPAPITIIEAQPTDTLCDKLLDTVLGAIANGVSTSGLAELLGECEY